MSRPALLQVPAQSRADTRYAVLQRKCDCGNTTSALGEECAQCQQEKSLGLQARLSIGTRDDPLEREADLAAAQVLQAQPPGAGTRRAVPPVVARHGSNPFAGRRQAVPDSVHQTLARSGEPLPRSARAFFEPRFGHDFSRVRIHRDALAAQSAHAVHAQAYAVGQALVFGRGHYAPDSSSGRALLAHELAHVVQQDGAAQPQTALRRRSGAGTDAVPETDDATQATTESAPIDMTDPVVLITLNGTSAVFYTAGGRTFIGSSSTDLEPGNYTLKVDFSRKRWWVDESVKAGERFDVEHLDADPWTLPYAGSIALQVGAGAPVDVPEMTLDERIGKVRALLENTWTGGDDEKEIIALIRDVPASQAVGFFERLQSDRIDDMTLLQRLDSDVHGDNNLALHEALSLLRMKTLDSEAGARALAEAPVIPWHDVMGFFETSVTFAVEPLANGKVRVRFHRGPMLKAGNEFSDELDELPFDMFVGGQDFDPNTILVIHDYDQGRFVPVMAGELAGYQHAGVRKFLSDVGTIAQFAVPVTAARTVAGKLAVVALERVLPAAVLLVDENRLNITRWFPHWGPRMIRYSDLVKTGLAAYGIATFAVSGYRIFQQWKQVRGTRRALDGSAPSDEAENIARQMERQADAIIGEAEKVYTAEKARKAASPLDDIDLGQATSDIQLPPGKAPDAAAPVASPGGKTPGAARPAPKPAAANAPPKGGSGLAKADDAVRTPAATPEAREAEVMRGISEETVDMLAAKPALRDALVAHPHAAQVLKLCNTPCYPDFASPEQVARLERLFIDEQLLGLATDQTRSAAIRRFLHEQQGADDLDRAIGILEGQLADVSEGRDLAKLREVAQDMAEEGVKGPDQARHALPASSTVARNRPGEVSGGRQLADVTDSWFPVNEKTMQTARVAAIPGQIARRLRRIRQFRSFEDFRETFWKMVAADPVLGRAATDTTAGWSAQNIRRMQQGFAPWAPTGQGTGGGANAKWQLNHKQAIKSEGDVYNLDNIEIVTPAFHAAIGD